MNCYINSIAVTKTQPDCRRFSWQVWFPNGLNPLRNGLTVLTTGLAFAQPVIGFPPAEGRCHLASRKNGKNQSPQPPPPRACPACVAAEARCPPPSDDSGLTEKSRMSWSRDQATTSRPPS